MKKFLAMLLAVVMVLSMAACSKQPAKDPNKGNDDPNQTQTITNPDQINDEMTSEDGKYEIAFITDVGQLKDKSFNQGTYDGVKLYAANNKLSYKYYQPANKDQATDDDRYEAMKAAAMKGLADSVQWALGKFYSNEFASIGGVGTSLGANENAVGLPTATWSLTKWTVDEYNTMLKDIVDGKITIDSDYNNLKSTDNVTLNII